MLERVKERKGIRSRKKEKEKKDNYKKVKITGAYAINISGLLV
jgi:hypothetical protein